MVFERFSIPSFRDSFSNLERTEFTFSGKEEIITIKDDNSSEESIFNGGVIFSRENISSEYRSKNFGVYLTKSTGIDLLILSPEKSFDLVNESTEYPRAFPAIGDKFRGCVISRKINIKYSRKLGDGAYHLIDFLEFLGWISCWCFLNEEHVSFMKANHIISNILNFSFPMSRGRIWDSTISAEFQTLNDLTLHFSCENKNDILIVKRKTIRLKKLDNSPFGNKKGWFVSGNSSTNLTPEKIAKILISRMISFYLERERRSVTAKLSEEKNLLRCVTKLIISKRIWFYY